MASISRLYLGAGAAGYSPPTVRGAWDDTAGAVSPKALVDAKVNGGTIAEVSRAETNVANEYDVLLGRWVSEPLAAQTISGNLNVMLGVRESSATANLHYHLHVYVTQGNTDTPRGTVLTDYREAAGVNEWPASAIAPRVIGADLNAATALASLAITAGDRLVVEIGYSARNTVTTSFTGALTYGTLSNGFPAQDFTDGLGGAAGEEYAGYIEFSTPLDVQPAAAVRASQVVVESLTATANAPTINLSQLVVETLITQIPSATIRLSHLYVETLTQAPSGPPPGEDFNPLTVWP